MGGFKEDDGSYLSLNICKKGEEHQHLSFQERLQCKRCVAKRFLMIFQCRIDPASIHIAESINDERDNFQTKETWVVENTESIRPYGVLVKCFDN